MEKCKICGVEAITMFLIYENTKNEIEYSKCKHCYTISKTVEEVTNNTNLND